MARKVKNDGFFSKFTFYGPDGGGIIVFLLLDVLGVIIGSILMAVFQLFMNNEAAMEYGFLVAYPVQFLPAMLYAASRSSRSCFEDGCKLDSNHYQPLGAFLCVVLVVLATLASGIVADGANLLLPPMPEALRTVFASMTGGNILVNLFCVAVMAPFFEEWMCRGMIMRGLLMKGVKPLWAIIISALFFGLIHANPWQAIPATLLGCLFGYVYYKTGSLKLSMLMHCTNNAFSVIISRIPALQAAESWVDVLGVKWFWIMFCACVLLIALIVKAFSKIPVQGAKGNLDIVKQ